MSKKKSKPDLATPGGRVRWLLDDRFEGNRSAMARTTKVSLTGLIKVVTDQQSPGRRLLEKIAANTDVSPAWLFVGEGLPYKGSAVPIADACLPGPPDSHADLLAPDSVPEAAGLYAPGRYWLRLGADEQAVRRRGFKFEIGDLMLMETDREKFPLVESMGGRWGVVRTPGGGPRDVLLARFTSDIEGGPSGPWILYADTYESEADALRVRRTVIELYPGGEFKVSEKTVTMEPGEGERKALSGGKSGEVRPPAEPWPVKLGDVVAVCVLILRRFE